MNNSGHQPKVSGLHLSPLHRKLKRLAAGEPILSCMRQLAVDRGCKHYENTFEPPYYLPQTFKDLSNEELIVGLCLAHFGLQPLDIRIAGELLGAENLSVPRIASLAAQERCSGIIIHIAKVGQQIESNNTFWGDLIQTLHPPKREKTPSFPHWSRFVSMTGISRNGGKHVEWLRPYAPGKQSRTHSQAA